MRGYNVGTECFAVLTCSTDPDFLLPVQIVILEKYSLENRITYKVKIKDIFESDFNYLKEHMSNLKLPLNLKSDKPPVYIKKSKMDSFENKTELLNYIIDKPFFLEDNYITLDRNGLKDLYSRFVKYLINYHYGKLFEISGRSFLSTTPIFENQKNMFIKRVEKVGFGDMFDKFELELDI